MEDLLNTRGLGSILDLVHLHAYQTLQMIIIHSKVEDWQAKAFWLEKIKADKFINCFDLIQLIYAARNDALSSVIPGVFRCADVIPIALAPWYEMNC